MIGRLIRRFRSKKFSFRIHLLRIYPWVRHDHPAALSWQRGARKGGRTAERQPAPSQLPTEDEYVLGIDQDITLEATLYAKSAKKREKGPYDKKELTLEIIEIDVNDDIYSSLGSITINLNERVETSEEIIRVPVCCAPEIRGRMPHLEMAINCHSA